MKNKRVRMTEAESLARYNKLLSLMNRPMTAKDMSDALGVRVEAIQQMVIMLLQKSEGNKKLVSRFKGKDVNPNNNRAPWYYIKHVDTVTAEDIGYFHWGECKAEKQRQDNLAKQADRNENINGIYLLSTAPSKKFVEKFKQQSQQMVNERKSPKAYAGTSAGMVW
jgi:hypothetical protein